uniref:Uncharacterized protein n=1 Tax=Oscillatoriales cyanobacterium SpSt-402 TaxID=2282168 RepID=A0A832H093_9CYAN
MDMTLLTAVLIAVTGRIDTPLQTSKHSFNLVKPALVSIMLRPSAESDIDLVVKKSGKIIKTLRNPGSSVEFVQAHLDAGVYDLELQLQIPDPLAGVDSITGQIVGTFYELVANKEALATEVTSNIQEKISYDVVLPKTGSHKYVITSVEKNKTSYFATVRSDKKLKITTNGSVKLAKDSTSVYTFFTKEPMEIRIESEESARYSLIVSKYVTY